MEKIGAIVLVSTAWLVIVTMLVWGLREVGYCLVEMLYKKQYENLIRSLCAHLDSVDRYLSYEFPVGSMVASIIKDDLRGGVFPSGDSIRSRLRASFKDMSR